MTGEFDDLFDVYKFTSGRRERAMFQIKVLADDEEWIEMSTFCIAGIDHEQQLHVTRQAYYHDSQQLADPRQVDLDARIGRTVGGLVRTTREALNALAEEPEAKLAQALLNDVFPRGVRPVTSLSYVDQASEISAILGKLESENYAETLNSLGLTSYVRKLRSLNDAFTAILDRSEGESVGFGTIRKLEAEGQDNLYEIIAMIVGRFPKARDDIQARTAWLAPIMEQNEALRIYHRNRVKPQDINPATGLVVDDNAPISVPAPNLEPTDA